MCCYTCHAEVVKQPPGVQVSSKNVRGEGRQVVVRCEGGGCGGGGGERTCRIDSRLFFLPLPKPGDPDSSPVPPSLEVWEGKYTIQEQACKVQAQQQARHAGKEDRAWPARQKQVPCVQWWEV